MSPELAPLCKPSGVSRSAWSQARHPTRDRGRGLQSQTRTDARSRGCSATTDRQLCTRRGFVMGRSVWASGEGRDEFPAAADAELFEDGAQMFLHGVGRDVQFFHDVSSGSSLQDEYSDTTLRRGESVRGEGERTELRRVGGVEDHRDMVSSGTGERRCVHGQPPAIGTSKTSRGCCW